MTVTRPPVETRGATIPDMSYVRMSDLAQFMSPGGGIYIEGQQDPWSENNPSAVDEHGGEEHSGSEYLDPFDQKKQPPPAGQRTIQLVDMGDDAAVAAGARAAAADARPSSPWPWVAAGFGALGALIAWRHCAS